MARSVDFNDFEVNKFAGLDLRGPAELQPEKTLSKCINFEVGTLGELKKRPGIVQQHAGATLSAPNGVKILGEVSNSVVHNIIVQNDLTGPGQGRVWKSNDSGVSWTQISTPSATNYECGKGVQYGGYIHIPSMSGLLRTDGGAFTVFGDAAIPRSNYRGVLLQDRMFILENSTKKIRWSETLDLGNWPASNFIAFGSEDIDELIGIIPYRDRLVTLRQNSIHVVYLNGPPSSWQVKRLPFNIGVANEDCAVVYNDLLYLLSYDGVYRTDLTTIEEISKPIAPLFRKRRKMVNEVYSQYTDCIAYYNSRIVCSMITDTNLYRMMVFNLRNNTWTEWVPNIFHSTLSYNPPRDMFSLQLGRKAFGAVTYQKEGIYMSFSNNGWICFFDDQVPVYTDTVGLSYPTIARTKSTNIDLPSQWKRCTRFSVRARKPSGGTNLTGLYNVNGVDGSTFNIPIDSTMKQTRVKGPGWFRELAIEVSDTSSNYLEIEDFVVSVKKKSDLSEVAT